jgi:hypothetical protein
MEGKLRYGLLGCDVLSEFGRKLQCVGVNKNHQNHAKLR